MGFRYTGREKSMTRDEILKNALQHYGANSQRIVAIEEMSELTKELCKVSRGEENAAHIAEEIADVRIMLDQMIILFDCRKQVEMIESGKLERLRKRLERANG